MKLFSILGGAKKTNEDNNVSASNYTKEFTYLPSYHWAQSMTVGPSPMKWQLLNSLQIKIHI